MKKRKLPENEEEQELRADRWKYKNMDILRDNPEQSGLYLILLTVCLLTLHITLSVHIALMFAAFRINTWTGVTGQGATVLETQALLSYPR